MPLSPKNTSDPKDASNPKNTQTAIAGPYKVEIQYSQDQPEGWFQAEPRRGT
jgi:hypothetical protein